MPRTLTIALTAGFATLLLAAALPFTAVADEPTLGETHALASDYAWDEAIEVAIQLTDGATSAGRGVDIAGDTVTITEPGTYRLSGMLSDGNVLVDSDEDGVVRLILDGVDITNASGAAIAVLKAEKTVVWLADGSQNVLADAAEYVFPDPEEDEPNATLFSKDDLTLAGTGALSIEANYNDGLASKDGLVIAGGTVAITAVDDAVRGKDYLVIEDGAFSITSQGDGLKSDNDEDEGLGYISILGGSFDIKSGTDAIEAETAVLVLGGELTIDAGDDGIHSEGWLEVRDGTIDIVRSYEGLEGTNVVISGGDIQIVASDDGLNVAGGDASTGQGGPGRGGEQAIDGYFADISGGTIVIDAGGDGFDSNGSADVSGGTIVINGPTSSGDGAIDVNGTMLVSGGTLLAAGSAGMAELPSASSEQAVLGIAFGATLQAGTVVHVQSSDGSAIITWEAQKAFETVVVSTPDLVAGETYEVLLDGQVSGTAIGGMYVDGDYSGGTVAGTLTAA